MKILTRAAGWLIAASFCVMSPAVGASARFEALLRQADAVRSSDSVKFRLLMRQLDAARVEATAKQLDQLSYLQAYANAYAGRYELAAEQAQKLIETSDDVNIQYRAGALVVNSFAVAGRSTDGLRQLERTLPLVERIKDQELRHHGLAVAAQIYNKIGQYELALRYAEQVLSEGTPPRTQCFAAQYRLEALLYLRKLPPDDAPIFKVIAQCASQKEVIVANLVRGTLARKWAALGRYDEAIVLIRGHLAESEATRFPRLIGEMHSLLAELLLAKDDLEAADRHAQAAIAQSEALASSMPLVAAYRTRYEVAERGHDPVAALEHYRLYAEADKSYLNDVKARELAYHIVRQESEQKNQQIELLKGQNEVLRLQQRVERQATQNSRLMVALLALLVASIGYWAYKIKRVHVSLRRFAETDALTGICNRHHFTQQAEKSIARCAKAGEPVALVMFDLDHFKAINDSYGHVTGDWVLKRVADSCKSFCREVDHVGRLGGEEFAILLHGCDLEAATRLAEACRVRLTQIDTRESGHAFSVTASFGVSAASLSGYDLAKLLSHADQMLYRAKRDGRNCVRGYAIDMSFASQTDASSPLEEASPARGGPLRSHQGLRGLGS